MARNCSGCKEKRPAHSLCTNCNKWLCSLCTEEHSHSKEAGGEHFLPVSLKGCSGIEGEANESPLCCPIHSQERLKLFCETCDVLTCRCCLLTEHKDHRFRHLQEALQNQRVILENITCKVEEKKNVMQVSAKHIEDRLFEAKHLQRKIENQIKMAKMVLISEINKRTNVLLEQLERITSERKQKMEQQLQGIVMLNRQFEHVQNFLSWAVCSKSTVPFLFSKELIVFQIQRLLETNCNADVGCPWKIRFTWDPSFWTKQLSNLGHLSMEGGPSHHSDVPTYASLQGMQPSLYHHHGHHSPVPQHDPLNNQPHQFQPPVHCLAPMCCAHCLNIPHMNKGQLSHQTVSHPQPFRQPLEMQQHHLQHFPVQYSLQQHEREQRCAPRVLKSMQPCAEQKPHQEPDSLTTRLGKNSQEPPMHHALPPIYPLSSQDGHQSQGSHPQQIPAQSSLPSPTVQGQVGPLQKIKLNNLQQQPHPPPPPPQPQPQPPQQENQLPPPPPLSPGQSPAPGPNEKSHEQSIQQSLDLMHHQFELEEMKKDLELLLQAQQPSLQLNQAKPPQHVQQTIVGQINYIVRQPAAVQQQNQEEVQQIDEDSAESEGQKPALPLDRNVIPSMPQPGDEATVNMQSPESILSPVRKRSASMNIVGFPNILEVDLSSSRATRPADSQVKEICSATPSLSQNVPHVSEVLPESVSTYNLSLDRPRTLSSENMEHLAIGGIPLVNPVCKLENEEFNHVSYPLGSNIVTVQTKDMNEMTLPLQNILEEPINLSVKKTQPCTSPPLLISNTTFMQSANPKPGHTEDCPNCEEQHFEKEIKSSQNNRICAKEVKIPYVRLERLKICTSESGELPIFKLQPQKSTHDGTFLLIIECGAQSSSMAIKQTEQRLVSQATDYQLPDPQLIEASGRSLESKSKAARRQIAGGRCRGRILFSCANQTSETGWKEVNQGPSSESLNPKLEENLEKSRILSQLTEQVLLPSGDHRLSNNMKKSGLPQEDHTIENEDFCAVCLNGGELLCCDYCPKVFHLSCHVPALLSFPVGEWVCTLCRNVEAPEVVYDCENTRFDYNTLMQPRSIYWLGEYDQKKCEKLVLSLFCNSLSLPFHEPVSPLARHYYQIIKKPMDLSIIRKKLQKEDQLHYTSSEELVADVRLMFWNCATFNYPDSEVAEAGRCLEIFFESKLKEIYPMTQFPLIPQDDSDLEDVEHENNQATPEGLQWPSYRQECIQPKRRRRHAENEKPKRPMFWPAKGFSQV